MSAGKGDTPRPVKGETYRNNYDAIFVKPKRKVTDLSHHFNPGFKVTLIEDPDNEVARMFREKPPICQKCGNNRQVWKEHRFRNAPGGVWWCHRVGCHHEVKEALPSRRYTCERCEARQKLEAEVARLQTNLLRVVEIAEKALDCLIPVFRGEHEEIEAELDAIKATINPETK